MSKLLPIFKDYSKYIWHNFNILRILFLGKTRNLKSGRLRVTTFSLGRYLCRVVIFGLRKFCVKRDCDINDRLLLHWSSSRHSVCSVSKKLPEGGTCSQVWPLWQSLDQAQRRGEEECAWRNRVRVECN